MADTQMKYLLDISRSALLFNLRKWRRKVAVPTVGGPDIDRHLLNLRRDGFSIVSDFFSSENCAEMRARVDEAFDRYPKAIWSGLHGADKRIFGIENLGGDFSRFFGDELAINVGAQYFGGKLENLQTLVGRIDAVDGNIGSGEGWHRDGRHFQFKALIYLSDVGEDNGAFQFIKHSHRLSQSIMDDRKMGLTDAHSTRITEEQVNILLRDEPDRLKTLTAPAGTMVLVDVSSIHRGSPIRSGRRYAMFNYYYPTYDIAGRLEKFMPRLSPEMVREAA